MAFPSYSGPLKNPFNDINNEDDEFGDFTSAVTFPPIGSCNGETGYQVTMPVQSLANPPNSKILSNSVFFNPIPMSDNDDEFGDFCGPNVDHSPELSMVVLVTPESASSVPPERNVKKCQPNYNIDLEEGLTGVSQLLWMSRKEEKSEEDEEEFTNFASAERPSQEMKSIFPSRKQIPKSVEEIFPPLGDMASDSPSTLQSLDHANDSKTDDEFGDFTQASSVAVVDTVEDLLSLDASFALESPGVLNLVPIYDCFDQQNEMQQSHFAAIGDVVESPQISWDKPLEIVDPLSVTVDEDTFNTAEDVKVEEFKEEEEEEFVFHQNVETNPGFCDFQTEPTIDVQVEDDGIVEEFGDFTDFQTATCEAVVVTSEDDEFDDFEIAPYPTKDCAQSTILPATTPETHIQRMLTTLFPVNTPSPSETELQPSTIPLLNSPGGSLWSYVSQLDSTPALSFSWRHSAAQQRFLHSLRIDSVFQAGNVGGFRWNSPSSVNSSASMSESFAESTVTLDLDFFLNPSTTATSNAASASSITGLSSNTSDSVLETIERELRSPKSKAVRSQVVASTVQSPALPVRHNNHQLSDIFQHLQLQENANHSSTTNRQIDLLQ